MSFRCGIKKSTHLKTLRVKHIKMHLKLLIFVSFLKYSITYYQDRVRFGFDQLEQDSRLFAPIISILRALYQ